MLHEWKSVLCNNSTLYVNLIADIASLCPEEAVLFSNTLTLQLQDIFADIHRPEVVHAMIQTYDRAHCIMITIESHGSAVPLSSVSN